MNVDDFDYSLPDQLIAKYPTESRSDSRLMVVDQKTGGWSHRHFYELLDYVKEGDLLVFNNTKVIPARMFGHKSSGGKVELLIERLLDDHHCLAHIKASKAPKPGTTLSLDQDFSVEVVGRQEALFELRFDQPTMEVMNSIGHMPLPPYIDRTDEQEDQDRYQTVYADRPGAVAAPTAGLHFDNELLEQLKSREVSLAYVTLHVGAGTFQPVRVENIEDHLMHSERIELSDEVCQLIKQTKAAGGRVIAVGTTSVRVLESAYRASHQGELAPYEGETDIFIYPGYQFQVVDGLITNFHLPKSTLLMLVSAFMGHALVMAAYEAAVQDEYRFFSYGDAMLLLREI